MDYVRVERGIKRFERLNSPGNMGALEQPDPTRILCEHAPPRPMVCFPVFSGLCYFFCGDCFFPASFFGFLTFFLPLVPISKPPMILHH